MGEEVAGVEEPQQFVTEKQVRDTLAKVKYLSEKICEARHTVEDLEAMASESSERALLYCAKIRAEAGRYDRIKEFILSYTTLTPEDLGEDDWMEVIVKTEDMEETHVPPRYAIQSTSLC